MRHFLLLFLVFSLLSNPALGRSEMPPPKAAPRTPVSQTPLPAPALIVSEKQTEKPASASISPLAIPAAALKTQEATAPESLAPLPSEAATSMEKDKNPLQLAPPAPTQNSSEIFLEEKIQMRTTPEKQGIYGPLSFTALIFFLLFAGLEALRALFARKSAKRTRKHECEEIAAALLGELSAAHAICLSHAKNAQRWPRIRTLVFQAYVGRLGLLGAELSRLLAEIYGRMADYQNPARPIESANTIDASLVELADLIQTARSSLAEIVYGFSAAIDAPAEDRVSEEAVEEEAA